MLRVCSFCMYYVAQLSVQSLSSVWLFVTPWAAALQASLSITNSQSLLKLMSIKLVMPSILCRPLFLLPSIFPGIRVFSNESVLRIRGPKFWSFSISPSNEYSGLISFRIEWFDLLAVQGTLKSLLQHHNSKAQLCFNIKKLRVWAEARVCFSWNIISLILYLKLLIFKILQWRLLIQKCNCRIYNTALPHFLQVFLSVTGYQIWH